ncbi:uncharacterized protein LOC125613090 [Marmota marmota marmota]|uniref:uncharacterized protein LOC125613090 n=1 Tax=Marmota marmota marmota TaxID=9994 RepID=UPI002093722B|nr:uncharacterized protein LOC125613090 [Marmota marmota marmota]
MPKKVRGHSETTLSETCPACETEPTPARPEKVAASVAAIALSDGKPIPAFPPPQALGRVLQEELCLDLIGVRPQDGPPSSASPRELGLKGVTQGVNASSGAWALGKGGRPQSGPRKVAAAAPPTRPAGAGLLGTARRAPHTPPSEEQSVASSRQSLRSRSRQPAAWGSSLHPQPRCPRSCLCFCTWSPWPRLSLWTLCLHQAPQGHPGRPRILHSPHGEDPVPVRPRRRVAGVGTDTRGALLATRQGGDNGSADGRRSCLYRQSHCCRGQALVHGAPGSWSFLQGPLTPPTSDSEPRPTEATMPQLLLGAPTHFPRGGFCGPGYSTRKLRFSCPQRPRVGDAAPPRLPVHPGSLSGSHGWKAHQPEPCALQPGARAPRGTRSPPVSTRAWGPARGAVKRRDTLSASGDSESRNRRCPVRPR